MIEEISYPLEEGSVLHLVEEIKLCLWMCRLRSCYCETRSSIESNNIHLLLHNSNTLNKGLYDQYGIIVERVCKDVPVNETSHKTGQCIEDNLWSLIEACSSVSTLHAKISVLQVKHNVLFVHQAIWFDHHSLYAKNLYCLEYNYILSGKDMIMKSPYYVHWHCHKCRNRSPRRWLPMRGSWSRSSGRATIWQLLCSWEEPWLRLELLPEPSRTETGQPSPRAPLVEMLWRPILALVGTSSSRPWKSPLHGPSPGNPGWWWPRSS